MKKLTPEKIADEICKANIDLRTELGYQMVLYKIKKLLVNQKCTCKDSTGWTDMSCCNICGKQIEGATI